MMPLFLAKCMEIKMNRNLKRYFGITTGLAGLVIMYSGWNISLDVMNERVGEGGLWPVYSIRNTRDLEDNKKYNLSSLVQLLGLGISLGGIFLVRNPDRFSRNNLDDIDKTFYEELQKTYPDISSLEMQNIKDLVEKGRESLKELR